MITHAGTTLTAVPVDVPPGGDADQVHYFCCLPDLALCGVDLAGEVEDYTDADPDECRLCVYMIDEALPCPAPECPGGDQ